MKYLWFIPIAFAMALAFAWVSNIVKLMDCDFTSPYKCEVIHGVGIIPPVSLITAWFGTDALPLPETQP